MLVAADFKRTTLSGNGGSITGGANSMIVVSTTGFPNPAGATYYLVIDAASSVTREIVGYTGLTGTTFTGLTRGLFGTSGQSHNDGVTIDLNIVAQYHELLKGELVAVATKVGIDSSGVNTTFDYKLSGVATGDKAVSKTGTETLTNKTLTSPTINTPTIATPSISGTITISTASGKIVPGATQLSFRDTGDTADNLLITNAGAITVRSTISGVTTLTATTLAGTLSTAGQSNVTSLGTLTSITTSGALTMTATASKIVPGATSFSIRDTGDANDNLLVSNAGNVTARGTLTATAVIISTSASKLLPGATSFSIRDTADANDNLLVANSGAITVRSTISGVTTLTATTVTATTLTGTLSTAAQGSVTSLGTLTSLTVSGTSTLATLAGAVLVTPAIVLGTAAAAGAAGTVIRSDATIVAFDVTAPTTIASADAATVGSVAFAARRDHRHGAPGAATATATGFVPVPPNDGNQVLAGDATWGFVHRRYALVY